MPETAVAERPAKATPEAPNPNGTPKDSKDNSEQNKIIAKAKQFGAGLRKRFRSSNSSSEQKIKDVAAGPDLVDKAAASQNPNDIDAATSAFQKQLETASAEDIVTAQTELAGQPEQPADAPASKLTENPSTPVPEAKEEKDWRVRPDGFIEGPDGMGFMPHIDNAADTAYPVVVNGKVYKPSGSYMDPAQESQARANGEAAINAIRGDGEDNDSALDNYVIVGNVARSGEREDNPYAFGNKISIGSEINSLNEKNGPQIGPAVFSEVSVHGDSSVDATITTAHKGPDGQIKKVVTRYRGDRVVSESTNPISGGNTTEYHDNANSTDVEAGNADSAVNKTIIGRIGEKIQNHRWIRKAQDRGMEPKQPTPDADAFIKTESPEVTRYRELMRETWKNQKKMSFEEFHDAKDKALREAFGSPKPKESPTSTATETTQQAAAEPSTSSTTPETNPKTSPTELADKTAQFDAIKDLYDQGRLTKEEYDTRIANLKKPLPSPISVPDFDTSYHPRDNDPTAPDSSTEAQTPKEPTNAEVLKNLGVDLQSEAGKTLLDAMNTDTESAKKVLDQINTAKNLQDQMKDVFDQAGIPFDAAKGFEFALGQVATLYKDELDDATAKGEDAAAVKNRSKVWAILKALLVALGITIVATVAVPTATVATASGTINK